MSPTMKDGLFVPDGEPFSTGAPFRGTLFSFVRGNRSPSP